MTREIVLDTETTGLDFLGGDRVVELGCVELVNHVPTGNHFHVYINPERAMADDAFSVHGLSDAFLRDKPPFRDIAVEFIRFIGDATLIIHNAPFDIGFLNFELDKCKLPKIINPVIDTVELARQKHPGARVSLDALCKFYGIDNSRRVLHGALLDAEILGDVYLELIGGRQVTIAFASETEGPRGIEYATGAYVARQRPVPIARRITEADIAAHRELVKSLGPHPLWNEYLEKVEG
jgi:DNA polymerase-3 subunit epsilon